MTIQVAIAEDQRIVRDLLAATLAKEADIAVVGEASTGKQALEITLAARPHLLLLDVGMPDGDGIEVARSLAAQAPEVKVVALSIHSEPRVVRDMLAAGAAAYVLKSAALTELVAAIRSVMEGKVYVSPGLGLDTPGPRLARRERQIVALVAEGKRTAEIAAQLGISPATVEVHRRNIMRKLDLHSVAELTRFAVREGLVSP